jgi:hypothetical protein
MKSHSVQHPIGLMGRIFPIMNIFHPTGASSRYSIGFQANWPNWGKKAPIVRFVHIAH